MNIKDLVYSSLMASLIVIMGFFPGITLFFSPVPITLQSLGVMLAGSLLGAKRGAMAVLIFLLLMIIGLPVLAGLVGGAGFLLTPAGGFLLSWPLAAFVIGWLTEKLWVNIRFYQLILINLLGGTIIMYAIGIPWMAEFAKITLLKAVYLSCVFIPGDLIKVFIASWVAYTFKKYYPLISSNQPETA